MALGGTMAQQIQTNTTAATPPAPEKAKAEQLRELKALLDEGILTQSEFDAEKKRSLGFGLKLLTKFDLNVQNDDEQTDEHDFVQKLSCTAPGRGQGVSFLRSKK